MSMFEESKKMGQQLYTICTLIAEGMYNGIVVLVPDKDQATEVFDRMLLVLEEHFKCPNIVNHRENVGDVKKYVIQGQALKCNPITTKWAFTIQFLNVNLLSDLTLHGNNWDLLWFINDDTKPDCRQKYMKQIKYAAHSLDAYWPLIFD